MQRNPAECKDAHEDCQECGACRQNDAQTRLHILDDSFTEEQPRQCNSDEICKQHLQHDADGDARTSERGKRRDILCLFAEQRDECRKGKCSESEISQDVRDVIRQKFFHIISLPVFV